MNVASRERILIADDHVVVGQGIAALLNEHFQSTELVTTGEALVTAVRVEPPDVVVSDISMPGISGLEAMQLLQSEGHAIPFVLLTMHNEPLLAAEAIRSGARGYILKSSAGDELVGALRSILGGSSYVTPSLLAEAIRTSLPHEYTPTTKQLHILERVSQGLRSKQIAYELGLSVRTIESHKYALMQALDVHGTLELIRKAEERGWISRTRQ